MNAEPKRYRGGSKKRTDLTGIRIGKLVVLKDTGHVKSYKSGQSHPLWLCQCDCGNTTEVLQHMLRSERSKSCGCFRSEAPKLRVRETLPKSYPRDHSRWVNMMQRCYNEKHHAYANYGGRGIDVCRRWQVFGNYLLDVGSRPERMTLDRTDNNGGYWCGVCDDCQLLERERNGQWATWFQQNRNRRDNVLVDCNGEMVPISVFAERIGFKRKTIERRVRSGYSNERLYEDLHKGRK